MQKRRNVKVEINKEKTNSLAKMFKHMTIVRSVELIALASEYGLLEQELPPGKQSLEAALFAAKYSGCTVSGKEIKTFLQGKS